MHVLETVTKILKTAVRKNCNKKQRIQGIKSDL